MKLRERSARRRGGDAWQFARDSCVTWPATFSTTTVFGTTHDVLPVCLPLLSPPCSRTCTTQDDNENNHNIIRGSSTEWLSLPAWPIDSPGSLLSLHTLILLFFVPSATYISTYVPSFTMFVAYICVRASSYVPKIRELCTLILQK